MSARAETKVFGIRLGIDPKILTGGLIAVAIVLIWFNTRSDDDAPPSTPTAHHDAAAIPEAALHPAPVARSRRGQMVNDRGTLRLRPIDPTRGDVDPTLRLDLLARLQNVQLGSSGRSLFEAGPPPLTPEEKKLLEHPPVVPKPQPTTPPPPVVPAGPVEPVANIPLKYYGFVKAGPNVQGTAGLFLDGDNIVVGSEGELLMKRYLVVSLTPTNARLEDTQIKKGQTLPVVPVATP